MSSVSVIIPAFNCEDCVIDAIRSAREQTHPPNEIIVVDDGSKDSTAELVSRYSKDIDSLTLLRHKENQGQNAANNTGLEHASSDFVAFLDADDIWFHQKLSKQIALLEERGSDYIACYCGVIHEDPWKRRSRQMIEGFFSKALGLLDSGSSAEGSEKVIEKILSNRFYLGGMSTILVESEICNQLGGFDENILKATDQAFLLRVLEHGKIGYCDEDLVRKSGNRDTNATDMIRAKADFLRAFSDLVIEYEFKGINVIPNHKFDIAKYYLREGKLMTGLKWLSQSKVPKRRDYFALAITLIEGVWESLQSYSKSLID